MDQDEVTHYEPPHQGLCCLQIQLLLSLVLKELIKLMDGFHNEHFTDMSIKKDRAGMIKDLVKDLNCAPK